MKARKAVSVFFSVILWIVIVLAALFPFTTLATRNSDNVASIGGYTPLTVATESMAPTFNAGDMILIKRCDTSKLKVGDIITFHTIIENHYALNTHRIASIEEGNGYRSFVTKGDNNVIADQHIITDSDVVGKYVVRIPGMGKFMNFLSGSVGFFVVIVVPMLLFFIYQVYHLIIVSISLKKAAALEAAEEARAAAEGGSKSGKDEEAEAKAREAEAKAREAEERLAELERLKAEYEAKIAEAEKLKESQKDE